MSYTRDAMVKLSSDLIQHFRSFETMEALARYLGTSVPTLYALMNAEREPSADFIEKITEKVGWTFEKAFEIEDDHP